MPNVKVVPDETPDPKAGKERQMSGYFVPYFDLMDSIEVARVVRAAGGRLTREQLAPLLKYTSTKSGTFLTRVSAAKAFGLIDQPETNSDIVVVSARGTAIVAPVSDAEAMQAKIDAFMDIKLFKLIYDDFRARELPQEVGLANLFENTHKMLKSRAVPAVKVMMASAETAGLFKLNGTASRKMVLPIMPAGGGPASHEPLAPNPQRDDQRQNGGGAGAATGGGGGGGGGGGNGGGQNTSDIHPAIFGLIANLPAAGAMGAVRRDALIAAFTATMKFIYPDREEG